MFGALKQYDKAVLDFTAAIGINPNYAEAYFNRGLAYDGLKRYAKAVTDYSEAIRLQPNASDIVQLPTEAYQALGGGPKQETVTITAPGNKTTPKKQVATKPGKKPTPAVAGTTPSATPSASVSLVQRWFVDHLRHQAHADLFPSPSPSAAPKPKQANN